MDFPEFFARATGGHSTYGYQLRIAEEGLPDVLDVPTGAGKTHAALLPWLWRRLEHPDRGVRRRTPRRLLYVLPLRVLVEQVSRVATEAVTRLGLADQVGVHTLMGGEGRAASAWRGRPDQPAVLIGTQDMLLSRALNRAYGESRFVAPIDFGMFNSGAHWVFDEVQLMGAGLPTSLQLAGLRRMLGTAEPSSSTWMSATIDEGRLRTVDLPTLTTRLTLEDADRGGALAARLNATKTVAQLDVPGDNYARTLATALWDAHQPGTRTIAVLNTVARAKDVYRALRNLADGDSPEVVLLHSRFRPPDRARHLHAAVEALLAPAGVIVVATQVLEAGVDVTSTTLFTEAAPWSSVVQRAGRCNRDGLAMNARLLWAVPPTQAPYTAEDLDAAAEALAGLEAEAVTPPLMSAMRVTQTQPEHAVLRRRDLIDLFDNAPDLSGNEIDVSRFVRDADELDVHVTWRELGGQPPREVAPPSRDERCPAPAGDLRRLLRGSKARIAWRFDPQDAVWVRADATDARPGRVLILESAEGGYVEDEGWSPSSKAPVDPAQAVEPDPQSRLDDAVDSDHLTYTRRWVPLVEHLADTERACAELLAALEPLDGISESQRQAAVRAARLHDIGKAHPIFQATMRASAGESILPSEEPWAKSGGTARARHERPHFRHELVTGLLLLGGAAHLLDDIPPSLRDLVVYLAVAHHGKVRLAIRSLIDEKRPDDPRKPFALGVWDEDRIPAFKVPDGEVPACDLNLEVIAMGTTTAGAPSWTTRALALRDAADLGPFKLGFLEAVVRLADWRASAVEDAS